MKLIAASVALMTSFSAVAGLGGLNVQSNLGEPFSGSITVTGDEGKALLNGGKRFPTETCVPACANRAIKQS